MKKIAWPYTGTTDHEMGSMTKSFEGTDQAAYTDYTFNPEQGSNPNTVPSVEYSESRMSPVDGDGEGSYLADDNELEEEEDDTVVSVYNEEKKVASFKCDIAKTLQDKINGLQVYSSLGSNSGLLFEYDNPQDVMYHMGTVKFPIDIIFLNKDKEIKRIYGDINPGTLGTFGCADVQFVLEVIGGTSDKLGFKPGDKVKIKRGNKSMIKSASLRMERSMPKMIYVYNFDGIISKNPQIKLSRVMNYDEENITLRFDGEVFTPGESITVNASDMNKYPKHIFSKTATGLSNFLENTKDTYEIYQDLKTAFSNPDNLVVFSTALSSPREVSSAFISKLEVLYGAFKSKDTVICKISSEYNHLNIIEDLRAAYPSSKIRLFADDEIAKKAGVPIPSDIKEQAKKAIVALNLGRVELSKSMDNISKNLSEYEKYRDENEKIRSTQGQYHQSVKRNITIAKQYLLSIRDAIKILNKIKDATTTMQIIESLASASHEASESIQEVFDLVNKMDTPDFVMLLTEATGNYDKAADDLKSTIDRAKDYINTDILGIIVLST
jgi:uncharacterized membrane protein (UPF0127 family)